MVKRRKIGFAFQLNGRSAFAGEERMIDPALGAVAIANAPPVFEFSGDFDRPAAAGVNPGHVMIFVWTAAHRHPIGLEADKPWNRQAAGDSVAAGPTRIGRVAKRQSYERGSDRAGRAAKRPTACRDVRLRHCQSPKSRYRRARVRAPAYFVGVWPSARDFNEPLPGR